ncbi:MAG TPA: NHL repeat-containing protein [Solirubrobacterales bacterium]|nr:NHL repeat-containing protein [Solirubrobacterales bacterium]
MRRSITALAALALAALLPGAAFAAGGGVADDGSGTISGTVPLRGMTVELMAAHPGDRLPERLGTVRSGAGGAFTLRYEGARGSAVKYLLATRPGGGAEAGHPVDGQSYRLAAALGAGAVPRQAKVTERTTVAMGFAMAQFIGGGTVVGQEPGLRNSAAMSGDLVDLDGGLAKVLRTFPNDNSTSTLATFDALANLLTICRRQDLGCARLLSKARTPGGAPAKDTLSAVVNIARYPWHDVRGLYKLALAAAHRRGTWQPTLGRGEAPDAWTLALRFEGTPPGMDGPGNFAIDAEGNIWVANNYAYSRESRKPACGSDKLFRFTPTGQTYPGSPYTGGGLSGVGFGITIDPSNRVWLGNFGFEGKGCETAANHYTASVFSLSGKALSPPGGWEVGDISWPQGTVTDKGGNIWLANCGNDSVTKIEGGDPAKAVNFGEGLLTAGSAVGFERPFGAAVNGQGDVFVTGNSSDSVVELSPAGRVLSLASGGGLHLPLGIAGDSNGYMWVSNNRWVVAPCPGKAPAKQAEQAVGKGGGTVTLLKPGGEPVQDDPIRGAGLDNPWGIAVDGADQVWVANFGGRRLSELCGTTPRNCPPGKREPGAAISPKSGYGFDGLVRNTGVAIDPSGNVWLANNWKDVPIQTNPGGYQIVAYLGLAAPVRAPQIGPPEQP